MKKQTKIVAAGRSKKWTQGVINPPVYRASTVAFDNFDEMQHATLHRGNQVMFYGRRGTPTTFAFQDAMTELEGGAGCAVYPCGTAAITSALLSFLKAGDHLLMTDTAYEPTRSFCDSLLMNFGIETTYYDPMIGDELAYLIRPNTKVLFLESPGSITMEVQDVPTLARIAHQHDVIVMLDNTWASPINFSPFEHGVDISIQAATKYVVGHSDVMLGTATANEKYWPKLRENSYTLGQCASPDDIYLAARGIRTLGVRLKQHAVNALAVANWLQARDDVDHVRHPAFSSCPGHDFFVRDFHGSNGLFSFVMNCGDHDAVKAMIEGMTHFKMGFSWGGFESLILTYSNLAAMRTATTWEAPGPLIRLHIGLEDPEDLIADLEAGFARFHQVIAAKK